MAKTFKKILIISIAVFGAGFFLVHSALAQNNSGLKVEIWNESLGVFELLTPTSTPPLFKETNFLPGQNATGTVRVTNSSGQPQRIVTEAINYPGFPNPDNIPASDLSRALSIIIREKGGSDLYGGSTGEKTLFDFYKNGETYLSDISTGSPKEYEYEITFPSTKGNEWQGATTTFDILIGFQGVEGGIITASGVRAGGFLPPGLTIQEESVRITTTTETSVTITWTTSYLSTSQVIYSRGDQPHALDLTKPNYGYAYSKEGDDSRSDKVIDHSVTITGLSPATTYYFRTVSRGSLAVSREYIFTTKGVAGATTEKPTSEKPTSEKREISEKEKEFTEVTSSVAEEIEEVSPTTTAQREKPQISEEIKKEGLTSLLMASLGVIRETPWMVISVVLCLIGLVIIGIRERELSRKKKKNIS